MFTAHSTTTRHQTRASFFYFLYFSFFFLICISGCVSLLFSLNSQDFAAAKVVWFSWVCYVLFFCAFWWRQLKVLSIFATRRRLFTSFLKTTVQFWFRFPSWLSCDINLCLVTGTCVSLLRLLFRIVLCFVLLSVFFFIFFLSWFFSAPFFWRSVVLGINLKRD